MDNNKKNPQFEAFYNAMLKISGEMNGKRTITLAKLKEIYSKVYIGRFHESITDWSHLPVIIGELSESGFIRIPSDKQHLFFNDLWLPRYVILNKKKENKKHQLWKDRLWHPRLAFLISFERLNEITFKRLIKLDNYLKNNCLTSIPISEKERSLQIYGDEKELVKLNSSFRDLTEIDFFNIANCFPTFEPLIGFKFPKSISNKVIFIENRDTFLSMCKLCYVLPKPPYNAVYYAQGLNFKTSVHSIPFEITSDVIIEYFGDIDYTGFRIPLDAQRILNKTHPKYIMQFAGLLYKELVKINQNTIETFKANDAKRKFSFDLDFLEASDQEYIISLLHDGKRIPQELLNLEEMYRIYSQDDIPQIFFKPHAEFLKILYDECALK